MGWESSKGEKMVGDNDREKEVIFMIIFDGFFMAFRKRVVPIIMHMTGSLLHTLHLTCKEFLLVSLALSIGI
jgi:hypothetical protein